MTGVQTIWTVAGAKQKTKPAPSHLKQDHRL